MLISLVLTVIMFSIAMSFVGLEQLGVSANLGPAAAARIVACCAPLILFGSAYLTIISAFAKTYREAQTYLQLVITVPTLPLIFAGLLGLQPKLRAHVRALPEPAFVDDHGGARRRNRAAAHDGVGGQHAGIRRDPHLHRRPALPARGAAGLRLRPTFSGWDERPAAESPCGAARAARDSGRSPTRCIRALRFRSDCPSSRGGSIPAGTAER